VRRRGRASSSARQLEAERRQRVFKLRELGRAENHRRKRGGGWPRPVDRHLRHRSPQLPGYLLQVHDDAPVAEVQIDVDGLEMPQRRLERANDVLAAVAGDVRIGVDVGEVVRELGGHYDAIAQPALGNDLAEPRPAGAVGVHVGGIEDVSARLRVPIVQGTHGVAVASPRVFVAEGHRTWRKPRNPQPGATQLVGSVGRSSVRRQLGDPAAQHTDLLDLEFDHIVRFEVAKLFEPAAVADRSRAEKLARV
jgi:hypothetical protein